VRVRVRGAFLCINYRGKLLQHKLIRVQCTQKSTRAPVSPVPQYGYSVQKGYFERFFMVTTCSRSTTRTTDCVLLSWAERNLGRYEHARARAITTQSFTAIIRAGAAAAFFCINYRGKLLQHKLIRVQCTNKSTRVPVSPVPQYGYSV
jgi:hypothetical protein